MKTKARKPSLQTHTGVVFVPATLNRGCAQWTHIQASLSRSQRWQGWCRATEHCSPHGGNPVPAPPARTGAAEKPSLSPEILTGLS